MTFALDTNIVIKYLRNEENVVHNFRKTVMANQRIIVPQVVDYEMRRGFRLISATRKKRITIYCCVIV